MSWASWMFKQRLPASARSVSGTDLLIVLFSFVLCHKLYLENLDFSAERSIVLFVSLGFSYGVFAAFGLYRSSTSQFLHQLLGRLTVAWFFVLLLVSLVAFLSKIAVDVSRVWFSTSMITSYVLLVLVRLVSGALLASSRKRGQSIQSVVVIGNNEQASAAIQRLDDNPWIGYRIARVFDEGWTEQATTDTPTVMTHRDPAAVDALLNDIHSFIESQRQHGQPVAEVWVSLPLSEEVLICRIISVLQDTSVDVCLLPNAFGMQFFSGAATNVAELPVVNISDIHLPGSAELFKRVFDRMVSLIAVVLLSPVMLAIAVCIKVDSKGPILFKQQRYGMDGREIEVWKFRSMSVQENGGEVRQATRYDARVTRIGAFLRRNSLDELPQFFNVLQGRMSIVGPRPHAVLHNEEYRGQIDGYMLRHKIKPGITGWAQVNGWRGETDTLDKMEERVRYDLEYIQNWSAWLDLKIIFMTVIQGFSGKNVY